MMQKKWPFYRSIRRTYWTATSQAMMFAFLFLPTSRTVAGDVIPELKIVGDWQIEVKLLSTGQSATLTVEPPKPLEVWDEKHDSLPEWIPSQPGWAREKIPGIHDDLCSARFAIVPGSVKVNPVGATTNEFKLDKDFKVDLEWGAIGRVSDGNITATQAVSVNYLFMQRRLDSIVLTPKGELVLRRGKPHIAMPIPPELQTGEKRVANIWLPAQLARLTPDNLFPILETSFPEPPKKSPTDAERLLPKTLAKLRNGQPLKILAWGDSVTEGYLGADQWQAQFVRRLKARFPEANIELITVGWGAHNSKDFMDAPPGHVHNFAETVLVPHPDLVVMEFANDCVLDPSLVERDYRVFLTDFQRIGAEWVILTPHYNSFMNVASERDLDDDPRAYVKMVRRFAPENGIALADASIRYGHLWREGIPYSTLMVNTANHPDVRGMKMFADSLMVLFP